MYELYSKSKRQIPASRDSIDSDMVSAILKENKQTQILVLIPMTHENSYLIRLKMKFWNEVIKSSKGFYPNSKGFYPNSEPVSLSISSVYLYLGSMTTASSKDFLNVYFLRFLKLSLDILILSIVSVYKTNDSNHIVNDNTTVLAVTSVYE